MRKLLASISTRWTAIAGALIVITIALSAPTAIRATGANPGPGSVTIATESGHSADAQTSTARLNSEPKGADESKSSAPAMSDGEDLPAYDPDAILVAPRVGISAEALNARLTQLDYIATNQVSADDVESGYVLLELAEGANVKDSETRIIADAADVIEAVQPNYRYYLLDDSSASATETAGATSAALVPAIVAQATAINDARASEQWALDAVHAYDAWDIVKCDDVKTQSNDDSGNANPEPNDTDNATKTKNFGLAIDSNTIESSEGDESFEDSATENSRVTVAVIDNGCLTGHDDLKNNIIAKYNAIDEGDNVEPLNGIVTRTHGTHVCGIVAAEANNGMGVAGVSHNAHLLPIQIFERKEENGKTTFPTSSSILFKAFKYIEAHAAEHNIRVVNMSIGTTGAFSYDDLQEPDYALIGVVKSAYDRGILTVCASGNYASSSKDSAYSSYPSDFLDGCALGVIATNKKDERASFSNFNLASQTSECTAKAIAAPGDEILSTYDSSTSSYGNLKGTSMAAPYVAGIAAMMFTANPELTPKHAINAICSTAKDIGDKGWDRETGYGLIDAAAAVAAVSPANPSPANPSDEQPTDNSADNPTDESADSTNSTDEANDTENSTINESPSAEAGSKAAEEQKQQTSETHTNQQLPATHSENSTEVTAQIETSITVTAPTVNATETAASASAKQPNTLTVRAKTKKLKAKTLKLKKKTVTALVVRRACGPVTFKKISGSKRLSISAKAGKVTVKKATKMGIYTCKVRVKAAGDSAHLPVSKSAKVRIKVI